MITTPRTWRNAYFVDFTSLASQNLKTGGNGTKTIDGKAWTWANDASALSSDVINGSGIVISANTTNTNYNGSTRTCPILTVPVATLFPSYSVQNHILRIMVRLQLTNSDTNFEFGGLSLEDATSPTSENIHILRGFSTTPERPQTESTVTNTTTVRQVAATTTDDILGLNFEAPATYEAWTGAYVAGQALTISTFRFSERLDMSNPLLIRQPQPTIGLFQITLNSTGSFTATFTHMQVDYYAKNPF